MSGTLRTRTVPKTTGTRSSEDFAELVCDLAALGGDAHVRARPPNWV